MAIYKTKTRISQFQISNLHIFLQFFIASDECAAHECDHGSCVDGINAYTCQCNTGWTATLCDEGILI